MATGPLTTFGDAFWTALDPVSLTQENVVAKINLLERLEVRSPYGDSGISPWERIKRSLRMLEPLLPEQHRQEWLRAALVIFANVKYVPSNMLEATWKSLYFDLVNSRRFGLGRENVPVLHQIHLFQNDPGRLANEFCHVNGLQGRLDTGTSARIEGTERLVDQLLTSRPDTDDGLRLLFSKPFWVLLADKALSGHSLRGDLEKLVTIRSWMPEESRPSIFVLCQVLTEQAQQSIADLTALDGVALHSGLYFPLSENLSFPNSSLIRTESIRRDARRLCQWFAEHVMGDDPQLDRMRQRSGDRLEFGYRNCGLTFVDHENCATDALPLLWYQSRGGSPRHYAGPYLRVHSRIGDQAVEATGSKWETLSRGDGLARVSALAGARR
ncbi:hypothetical protein [Nocardioides sp. 503]|uniref:phosphoribosyltransferase-like protein n=1 Tax=Nocardioides sp. 503 TaxID=2508326 RepID=UPI001FD691CC|nr:hypothetical protein [Nocardioides sp. 503]